RGGTGILFTLVALIVGLVIGAIFITPVEELHKYVNREREAARRQPRDPFDQRPPPAEKEIEKKDIVETVTKEIGRPVAKWATGDDEQADFLVKDRPALVSAILMVMLIAMPFLICLGSFNQLAGDIQYKGLRYLLLRTERA